MGEITISELYVAVANAESKIQSIMKELESEFDSNIVFDIVVDKYQYSGEPQRSNITIEVKLKSSLIKKWSASR